MTTWLRWLLTGLLGAMTIDVGAASLRMSPIGLDLAAPAKAGAINLTNTATEPVDLQIRIFKWTQADGKDVLTETRDVLVSPPVATVKPDETYTVRVVRLTSKAVSGEEPYRLVIDELPKPIDPRTSGQAVRMVLRTSMPVFFSEADAKFELKFTAWTQGNKAYVQAVNMGQRHYKMAGLTLKSGDAVLSFGSGLNGYILPGQTMQFEAILGNVTLPPGPAALKSGLGSSAELSQQVTVEAR